MKEFQGKRRFRRLIYSWPLRLLLVLLIILLASSVYRLYQKQQLVLAERQVVLDEVARLTARQKELAAEVARLETDRGVEELIRKNFNVVKTGEKVITLVTTPITTTLPPLPPPPLPWWRIIIGWLKRAVAGLV